MKTEKLRFPTKIIGCIPNNPDWRFFFLEEKLVPNEFENVAVVLICTRLD